MRVPQFVVFALFLEHEFVINSIKNKRQVEIKKFFGCSVDKIVLYHLTINSKSKNSVNLFYEHHHRFSIKSHFLYMQRVTVIMLYLADHAWPFLQFQRDDLCLVLDIFQSFSCEHWDHTSWGNRSTVLWCFQCCKVTHLRQQICCWQNNGGNLPETCKKSWSQGSCWCYWSHK